MGTGVSNFRAACCFRMRETIFPAQKYKIPRELQKSINLWDFIIIDARPLMIVDKGVAIINRFDSTISDSIVFKNQAFDRFAAALDVNNLLRKLLDYRPGSPLYLSGKTWGNYLLQDGRYIVVTGDATQFNEVVTWTPAEGWRPPEAPTSSYPFQYIQTEISKYGMITRDSSPPTNPMLDWTRKSLSKWLPEHYIDLFSVQWKDTPMGDMGSWSGSLRTVVNSIMVHPYQMALFWGKEYVVIYNASYADCIQRRHPQLLGQELAKGWPEAYQKVRSHLDACRRGISIIRTGDNAPVDRVDTDEECYFDWTLTPILEKAGNVGGVLWQQYEGTARVLQNRRQEMLKSLRQTTANSRSVTDFWPAVFEAFDLNTYDTPFVALYQIRQSNENEAILLGTRGIPEGHSVAPQVIVLAEYNGIFADEMREARRSGSKVVKGDLLGHQSMRLVAHRGFKRPCSTAVIIPIQSKDGDDTGRTEAIIILGCNPRRRLDDDYEIFIDQIRDNITEYLRASQIAERVVEQAMQEQLADVEIRRASELAEKLREVEAKLLKNELRFTNMASTIPIGLVELDCNNVAIFANDAWHEVVGIPKTGNLSNLKWCDIILPEDHQSCKDQMADAVRSGVHVSIEYRVMDTSDGFCNEKKVKWVVSEVLPVYTDEGGTRTHHGFYATVTDVTFLKVAEEAQKERADEALERTKQQERFIDMTCHELRNPLSAILQYSGLVLDLIDEDQGTGSLELLDSITDACNTIILCTTHQRRIIDDILVTSKLDSGLIQVEPVDFNPQRYFKKALGMYHADAQSKGVSICFTVDQSYRDLSVEWLKGDPARVMQILSNLITNAIKFTAGNQQKLVEVRIAASLEEPTRYGDVHFNKEEHDDGSDSSVLNGSEWGSGEVVYLIISTTDTGIGISDEVQKLLFVRFQQAPKTESKYGGSGLGLYICKNLCKLLGGSIGVASKEGEGSQFSFYVATKRGRRPDGEPDIPEWFGQAAGRIAGSTRTSRNTGSHAPPNDQPQKNLALARRPFLVTGFKILIVEDNLINQKVMKRQLEARQCIVFAADNGKEALEFIQNSSLNPNAGPDADEIEICFMDCEMPVMNGIEASRRIRELQSQGILCRHLPILGVSANIREPKVQEMKNAGMDEVLCKPYSIDQLVQRAAALVNATAAGQGDTASVGALIGDP